MVPPNKQTPIKVEHYVTLPMLYDKLEDSAEQNRTEHQEIRQELSKGLTALKDTTSQLSERLIKIENVPAHEKFQQVFCPNTKTILETGNWVNEHKIVHKELIQKIEDYDKKIDKFLEVIREDRVNFAQERLTMQIEGNKRLKWAIIGMIITIVTALILRAFGI